MNNFFYNLTFVFLSSLGIGYLSRFREIITIIVSSVFVLILPDNQRPLILISLICIYFLFFAITYKKVLGRKEIHDKIVFKYSLGIWISMISPFIYFSPEWLIICTLLFIVIRKLAVNIMKKENGIETGIFNFLKTDIFSGTISLLTIQILYSGYNLFFLFRQFIN